MIRMALTATLFLGGCLGRPVVGELPPPDPTSCRDPDFDCQAFVPAAPPAAIEDSVFMPGFEESCGTPQVLPECGNVTDDAHLASVPTRNCASPAPIRIERDLVLRGMDFSCSSLHFELAQDVRMTLVDAQLTGTSLQIQGEPGSTLEVHQSDGHETHLLLGGDAWLDLAEVSFTNLRVDVDKESLGRSVTVADSVIEGLFVRGGIRSALLVARSALFDAEVQTGELQIESGSSVGIQVEAARVTFSGGDVQLSDFSAQELSFIGSRLSASNVHECQTAHLIGVIADRVQLGECSEGTFFDNTTFGGGVIAGSLDVNGGGIGQTGFLGTHASVLNFQRTGVTLSAFCDVPEITSAAAQFVCVSCTPEILSVSLESSNVSAPACPSLEEAVAAN